MEILRPLTISECKIIIVSQWLMDNRAQKITLVNGSDNVIRIIPLRII